MRKALVFFGKEYDNIKENLQIFKRHNIINEIRAEYILLFFICVVNILEFHYIVVYNLAISINLLKNTIFVILIDLKIVIE